MGDSKKILQLLQDAVDRSPHVMAGPSVVEKRLLTPVEPGFADAHIADRLRQAEDAKDAMTRLGIVSPQSIERTHNSRIKDITQEASQLATDDDYALALRQKKALEEQGIKTPEDASEYSRYKDLLDMMRQLREYKPE